MGMYEEWLSETEKKFLEFFILKQNILTCRYFKEQVAQKLIQNCFYMNLRNY